MRRELKIKQKKNESENEKAQPSEKEETAGRGGGEEPLPRATSIAHDFLRIFSRAFVKNSPTRDAGAPFGGGSPGSLAALCANPSGASVPSARGSVALLVLLCVYLLGFIVGQASASEFPERECCDPVYPPNTATTPSVAVTQATGKPGLNIRTSIAILNCLLARQLCFEDASCSAILEIIPRVCGSELVACSTVTVTKCQAALRTLQAFPFFKPTCLCREPNVDPECNSFRDFLFDHPCVFVLKKEKDPYPVEALPTCTYALSVCHGERACAAIFERFKTSCRVRDGECRMDDREQCRDSWAGLRMSPLFGCICPNNHAKKRCDRIFALVNHNPCVVRVVDGRRNKTSKAPQSSAVDWVAGIDLSPEGGDLVSSSAFDLHVKDHISPHIMREGHGRPEFPGGGHTTPSAAKTVYGPGYIDETKKIGVESGSKSGLEIDLPRPSLRSTCQVALEKCIKDSHCVDSLTPILQRCDASRCDRDGCMSALRAFYRTPNVDWNLEIAFCLCKKTDNKSDSCMNAQDRLHPSCAQRPVAGGALPACHTLAQNCREDAECRSRLEAYEQSCAVDSVTRRCAGAPAACRSAVLSILGTRLRAACACKGTDFAQLYDCLGWQRLLWLNPCVVESQSDYHIKTYGLATTTVPMDVEVNNAVDEVTAKVVMPQRTTSLAVTSPYQTSTQMRTSKTETQIIVMSEETARPITTEKAPTEAPVLTTVATTTAATTTVATTTTRRTTTTTQRTTTSTEPAKYCVVQRPELEDQYIRMGETKRLYRDADLDLALNTASDSELIAGSAECTELCHCGPALRAACHTACVRRLPCSTKLAHYSHSAPAYQAYRGRCFCYSGSFICMRPNPGEYHLPQGVYLLLGFSAQDEMLLRPHTSLGVEDTVRVLQDYIDAQDEHGHTNCTLTLFNMTSENLIISAGLSPQDVQEMDDTIDVLDKEKEACIDLLENVKGKINSQHEDISTHLLLSIFKIAEVDVIYPAPASKGVPIMGQNTRILLVLVSLLSLLRCKSEIMYTAKAFLKIVVGILPFNIVRQYSNFISYRFLSLGLHNARKIFYLFNLNIKYFFKNIFSFPLSSPFFVRFFTIRSTMIAKRENNILLHGIEKDSAIFEEIYNFLGIFYRAQILQNVILFTKDIIIKYIYPILAKCQRIHIIAVKTIFVRVSLHNIYARNIFKNQAFLCAFVVNNSFVVFETVLSCFYTIVYKMKTVFTDTFGRFISFVKIIAKTSVKIVHFYFRPSPINFYAVGLYSCFVRFALELIYRFSKGYFKKLVVNAVRVVKTHTYHSFKEILDTLSSVIGVEHKFHSFLLDIAHFVNNIIIGGVSLR